MGQESNLEDLHLPSVGIYQKPIYLEINHSQQYLEYEILVPTSFSILKFDYYSLSSNKFEIIKLPIVLQEDLLSTQYGISPHLSGNISYQKVLVILGILVCFVLFYLTRHIVFILFGTVLVFVFVLSLFRFFLNDIELKSGTTVFVLPTTNSYIYKKLNNTTNAKVLVEKPKWSKVLLENEKIGWVKNENINLH